jgi:hypothetical protein
MMSDMPDNEEVHYGKLVDGLTTEDFDPGEDVIAVFSLFKIQDAEGDEGWTVRSGGEPLSQEELLGVLTGLAASIKRDLAEEWEW